MLVEYAIRVYKLFRQIDVHSRGDEMSNIFNWQKRRMNNTTPQNDDSWTILQFIYTSMRFDLVNGHHQENIVLNFTRPGHINQQLSVD